MNGIELLLERLTGAGEAVWRASWQASVLAGLVLAVQLVFGRRIAPRWRHAMWVLVLVRLALPVVPSSRVSVFNLAPLRAEQPAIAPDPVQVAVAPQQPLLSSQAFEAELRARAARYTPSAAPAAAVPSSSHAATLSSPPPAPRDLWKGWPQALAAIWAAGVLLLAARVAWATWRVSRAMRRLDPVTDVAVLDVLRAAAAELRVGRPPALRTGDDLFSPALVGFVRPRLLLPRDLLARFDAAELRLVLLHELAHLKRRDVLVNWFATLLTVLHWPNPVAWLVAWRLRLERELATDELVMSRTTTEADRRAYGHTIVKLLENLARGTSASAAPSRAVVPAGGVGILEGKQQMKRRITMIAGFANRNRAWTVVAASLVLGLGLVALTDAAQQAPAPADQASKADDPGPAKAAERETAKPAPPTPGSKEDAKDYVVGPNDLLQVTIYDLEGPGLQTIKTARVSGTGNIMLPYLQDAVRAEGMTEWELKEALARAYEQKGVLKKANVFVTVAEARNLPKPKPEIAADELVTVSVMDLTGAGVETVKTARVDAEGKISLPYIGRIKAAGLTSADFEQAVAKAYEEKKLLQNALVAVSLPGRGESHRLSNKADAPAAGGQGGGMPPGGVPGMPGMPGRGAMPDGAAEMMMEGGLAADAFGGAPADPATKAMLERKLPEVAFDGVPLTDVVDFLRDVTEANIFVDWRALEAAGVERNGPVSARLKDVAVQDALAVILRSVDHSLQFTVRNGIIQIGAAKVPPKPTQLVVSGYDVGDLVAAADDKGGGAQAVANVISQTVRPDFWRGGGGGGGGGEGLFGRDGGPPVQGTISEFGDKVVIMATPEVHQEVEALLTVLRQPSTKPPTTQQAAKAQRQMRVEDMSVEDIAQVDQQMAQHLQMKQEIEQRIEQLKQSGVGENSPSMKPVLDMLKIRSKLIQDRTEWFREKHKDQTYGQLLAARRQEH